MRHSQLRAFYHVAVMGGFSRAARAMGVSQPAVSDQVRKLEAEYDVRLFDRSGHQARLTGRGRALLEVVRPMFEIEARARELLSETRALPSGELRIIADAPAHLTEILALYRGRYPDVRIRLRIGNSREAARALADYEADIGVTGDPDTGGSLDAVALGAAPIIAFAARDFPRLPPAPADFATLARLPLVMREDASQTRRKVQEAARAAGMRLKPAIEAEGREAARDIVAAGLGIGFVSEAELGPDPRLVKIPLAPPVPVMEGTVISLRRRRDVPAIRRFMDCAREIVAERGRPGREAQGGYHGRK